MTESGRDAGPVELTGRLGELFGLAGRVAVVTGGASGIGEMIARGYLEAGATVVVSSRKPDRCRAVAEELSRYGTCVPLAGDISTREGVAALAAGVEERFDRLDILVNNAGATWGAKLADYPEEAWTKVLRTNLIGPFQLTVELLGLLRAAATADRPARVINVGSFNGIAPPALESYAYSSSKAGVHMLTRHLARRLAAEHITVNTIAPGPFESRMTSSFDLTDPGTIRAMVGEIPLVRIGRPDDMAAAALYLAGAGGSWITGTTLCVDGGSSGCL